MGSGQTKDWRTRLELQILAAERLFILGVGNRDRSDDGAGSLAARRLSRKLGNRPSAEPMPGARATREHTRKDSRDKRIHRVLPGASPGKASPEVWGKRASSAVQVLDGGAAPENATGIIRRFRPTHVLIIDAADNGRAPGAVFFIDEKKIADDDLTTHRIPLSHLVRYLAESIGCRVILVGIQPGELSADAPVSPAVKAAVGSLVSVIAEAIPI